MAPLTWTVEVTFSEGDEGKTRADAVLIGGPEALQGWGLARRRPRCAWSDGGTKGPSPVVS